MIEGARMSALQYLTILICFVMNMLDGMDVLVIAFSATSISTEWDLSPSELGVVFSSAVVGMTIGALLIAPMADKIGRKKLMIICALVMGISIFSTAYSQTLIQLMTVRFISGLGIGGMLASSSTLASEYAPKGSKDFWVGLVIGGYPVGAVMAGLIASYVIPEYGWRSLFQVAGIATLITVPLMYLYLSPSIEFLVVRKPNGALEKVNSILIKLNQQPLTKLPSGEKVKRKISVKRLFEKELSNATIRLWSAFFMSFATLYFLLSWIPKLTTEAGLSERLGIYSGTVFNIGSFIGVLIMGALAIRIGLKETILIFLVTASVLMILFGFFSGSPVVLILFGFIGFSMQAGFVGLYPLAAKLYPAAFRSTGVGWAIGAGRFGAILGPIAAGYIISAGHSLTVNFMLFSIPCAIAGILAFSIKLRQE